MITYRLGLICALIASTVFPASAQLRRPLTCTEEASAGLDASPAAEAAKTQMRKPRTFSLVSGGGLLTMISAGRSDYYECQQASPRLNERTPRNAIKCQNGVYFILLDLNNFTFVDAQLNPEDRSEVKVRYGSCSQLQ